MPRKRSTSKKARLQMRIRQNYKARLKRKKAAMKAENTGTLSAEKKIPKIS